MERTRYFVYVYRDLDGKAQYVGYGGRVLRATSHQSASHNRLLAAFLGRRKFLLEACGPFGSERTGRAVETALISALRPRLNRNQGESKWRLWPIGVPENLVERLVSEPLTRKDLLRRCRRSSSVPYLSVPTDTCMSRHVLERNCRKGQSLY